ncbi:hypothetical protein GCM10010393_46640 [Streptomyces gobitricini]|uniref:Uncharacterized protein n=1 Tax=Streptomyces gobitricini TaxID=68211 RepID=A0ABN3MTG3_9ACTN
MVARCRAVVMAPVKPPPLTTGVPSGSPEACRVPGGRQGCPGTTAAIPRAPALASEAEATAEATAELSSSWSGFRGRPGRGA